MGAMLRIDLGDTSHPKVHAGGLIRTGKWVEFYGALAISRTDPGRSSEFLTHEELHRMLIWNHVAKLESVGKMVARQWTDLETKHDLHVLESPYRTKCWRLKIPPEEIEFVPDRATVVAWLDTHLPRIEDDEVWMDELEALVSAQIALQWGDGETVRDLIRPHAFKNHPEFDAWVGLLDARAADIYISIHDNECVLDALFEQWSTRTDVVGRSVAARIAARIAHRMRLRDPDVQLSRLSKIAADLEHSGDIGALACVLNVEGILMTRTGQPERASYYHCRAAALFGLVGDYNSLQGALFNLAHCRVKSRAKAGLAPDIRSLQLLELGEQVCRTFNVGRDTVQSEISGCHWCLDVGDIENARVFLEAGKAVVEKLDSEYDQACYLLARGRLALLDPEGGDPFGDLHAARRLFEKVGDRETLRWIDALLAAAAKAK